jgi:hypothetical protein
MGTKPNMLRDALRTPLRIPTDAQVPSDAWIIEQQRREDERRRDDRPRLELPLPQPYETEPPPRASEEAPRSTVIVFDISPGI